MDLYNFISEEVTERIEINDMWKKEYDSIVRRRYSKMMDMRRNRRIAMFRSFAIKRNQKK